LTLCLDAEPAFTLLAGRNPVVGEKTEPSCCYKRNGRVNGVVDEFSINSQRRGSNATHVSTDHGKLSVNSPMIA
jgi:hypothetical protein